MYSVPTTAKIVPTNDGLPFPASSLNLLLSSLFDQSTPFAMPSLNASVPWGLQTRPCLKRRVTEGLQHREVPEEDAHPTLAPALTAWLSPTYSSHLPHTPLPTHHTISSRTLW